MTQRIEKTITIHASPARVWEMLTNRELMVQWMAEPEMQLEIDTNWKVGSPFILNAFHHIHFKNHGTVLRCEPLQVLEYSQLSSLSGLPDKPENYSVTEFRLTPLEDKTLLTLIITNFPLETIFRHIDFYWNGTLKLMKELTETTSDLIKK